MMKSVVVILTQKSVLGVLVGELSPCLTTCSVAHCLMLLYRVGSFSNHVFVFESYSSTFVRSEPTRG